MHEVRAGRSCLVGLIFPPWLGREIKGGNRTVVVCKGTRKRVFYFERWLFSECSADEIRQVEKIRLI